MITMTSRKFSFPEVIDSLFKVSRKGKENPIYSEAIKYVDVENNRVYFCVDGKITEKLNTKS